MADRPAAYVVLDTLGTLYAHGHGIGGYHAPQLLINALC
jgi:hypothetical protein